jgi:WD40 repeat protein
MTRRQAALALVCGSSLAQVTRRSRYGSTPAMLTAARYLPFLTDAKPRVVTGSVDGMVRIIDGETTEVKSAYQIGRFSQVAFSPDGAQAFAARRAVPVAGSETELAMWRVADGDLTRVFKVKVAGGSLYAVAVSPDGRLLAAAGFSPFLFLWDIMLGGTVDILPVQNARILALEFDGPKELRVITESGELGTYRFGSKLSFGGLDGKKLIQGTFSRNGRTVAATAGYEAFVWDSDKLNQLSTISIQNEDSIDRMALSDGGEIVASATQGGGLRITSASGEVLQNIELAGRTRVTTLCLAPDKSQAFISSEDGKFAFVSLG